MTKSRFRYDLSQQHFKGPAFRVAMAIFGVFALGITTYFFVAEKLPVGEEGLGFWELMPYFQMWIYGILAILSSTGVLERYYGQYVEITLGAVEWRLPDGDDMEVVHLRRKRISLARVQSIQVGVLHVTFRLLDGSTERLPLGFLPYPVVQEVKRRFEGASSLKAATGGALSSQT